MREQRAEVGSVLAGSRLQVVEQNVARLEDAGVVGEEAEHDPHQEAFKVVLRIPGVAERVVELSDQFRSFDVRWILIQKRPRGDPEDEAELLDVVRQLFEPESEHVPLQEVAEFEVLEIADQDVAGLLVFREGIEIAAGLLVGLLQIAPGALLLDDQDARPEEVDESARVVELPHVLLVAGHGLPAHPEDAEEVVVEALGLALLVVGVRPLPGEGRRSDADLVPGQAHVAGYRTGGSAPGVPHRRAEGKALTYRGSESHSRRERRVGVRQMETIRSKITSRGRVSILARIRRKLGLTPGSTVEWSEQGPVVIVRRVTKYSSLDIHRAVFPSPPERRAVEEMDARIQIHVRHARSRN